MKRDLTRVLSILITVMLIPDVYGDSFRAGEYWDGHRGKVFFPLGEISFADEVVSFEQGEPGYAESDPRNALGAPTERRAAVLGCGGVLTLRFADNALIDVEGPDLYVFESGQNIEPTFLSISEDGREWIAIGEISGGRAGIDIAAFIPPGKVYHYVRLRDAKGPGCGGTHPGADINAVGAIGSALQFSLKDLVLFEFGKWDLKEAAREELHRAAMDIEKYPGGRLVVEGHTDSVGGPAFNQELSEKRAAAVREYFIQSERLKKFSVVIHGYGEARPVASNDTEEGRGKNRRVDLVFIPERLEEY